MKAVCMTCGAPAVWELAPADSYGEYCDDCVPRGCSCNVIDFGNPRARKQHRDERGRLLPCCEYWFEPTGFKPSPPDKVARYRAKAAARDSGSGSQSEAGTAEAGGPQSGLSESEGIARIPSLVEQSRQADERSLQAVEEMGRGE